MRFTLLYSVLFSYANIVFSSHLSPLTPRRMLERRTAPVQDTTDDSYKLPRSLIPYQYDLALYPNIYEENEDDFNFYGQVRILMKCKQRTDVITLHSKNLELREETIQVGRFRTTESINVIDIEYDTERDFVHFTLNEDLVEGRLYYIQITYRGPLTVDLQGLYLSYYYEDNEKKYLATTQMEPTDARQTFPCFDEPDLKAVFNMSVSRQEGWTALTNTPKINEVVVRYPDFIIDYFALTPKMPTYLVAVVVSQFQHRSTVTAKGTQFGVWSKPEDIDDTTLALRVGSEIHTFFENYFELDYPLPKQDMIEVPHFPAGAMENWGLIIYAPGYMVIDENDTGYMLSTVVEVIAHELAHQWFGNIVTLHWWSDTWLNEGFANFFQYIGSGFSYPDWNQRDTLVEHSMRRAMSSDASKYTNPMHTPVTLSYEIRSMFGTISYSKGGAVLRMMEHFLGRETFRKGLSKYLKKKSYGNAVPDDLWYAMSNQSSTDGHSVNVKGIMDTWIYQKNFPVLMVTQDNNGNIDVTQKRFLSYDDGSEDEENPSPFGYIWSIPFTYTTSSERNFNKTENDVIFIDQQQQSFQTQSNGKDDWIIANIQEFGYYRVNYDEDNWNSLIEQLENDRESIHPLNRAKLQNDASALAYAGELDQDIATRVWEANSREDNLAPIQAALADFKHVEHMLAGTKNENEFKEFVQESVQEQYGKYGLTSEPQNRDQSEKRKVISEAACEAGLKECVDKAVEMYQIWMNSAKRNAIAHDIQKAVFCTGIREGRESEWNAALRRYRISNDAIERRNLVEGMACTKINSLLSQYLELTLSDEMPVQDATKAVDAVSKNPNGRKLVWIFLNDNWNAIEQRFGKNSMVLETLMEDLSSSFHTEADIRQMKSFQSSHNSEMGSAKIPFKQDVEKTKANMKWMETNYQSVANWLEKRKKK